MIGWVVCRLFHRGFRFARVATAVSGAMTAYTKCTVCGRYASAPIPKSCDGEAVVAKAAGCGKASASRASRLTSIQRRPALLIDRLKAGSAR